MCEKYTSAGVRLSCRPYYGMHVSDHPILPSALLPALTIAFIFLSVCLNVDFTCVICVLMQEILPPGSHTGFSGLHLPFIGFTFTTERCV
jgi:hypothetical protein